MRTKRSDPRGAARQAAAKGWADSRRRMKKIYEKKIQRGSRRRERDIERQIA